MSPFYGPIIKCCPALDDWSGSLSHGSGPVFMDSRWRGLARPSIGFENGVMDVRLRVFTWRCLRRTFTSRLVMSGKVLQHFGPIAQLVRAADS